MGRSISQESRVRVLAVDSQAPRSRTFDSEALCRRWAGTLRARCVPAVCPPCARRVPAACSPCARRVLALLVVDTLYVLINNVSRPFPGRTKMHSAFFCLYCGLEIFAKQHISFARWKGSGFQQLWKKWFPWVYFVLFQAFYRYDKFLIPFFSKLH